MLRLQGKALNRLQPPLCCSRLKGFASSQESQESCDSQDGSEQSSAEGEHQEMPSKYFRDANLRKDVSKFKVDFDKEV